MRRQSSNNAIATLSAIFVLTSEEEETYSLDGNIIFSYILLNFSVSKTFTGAFTLYI